jgi:putative oxidoreductase
VSRTIIQQETYVIDATISHPQSNRARVIWIWILRGLLALVFAAAGSAKLAGPSMLVAEFDAIGLGQWFRYVTGLTEIAGAVLLLMPRTVFFGALILLGVCCGAFVAQIGPLHGDVIHVFVLAALILLTLWLTRPAVRA